MTELTFRMDYQAGDRRLAAGDEFRAVIAYELVEEGLSAIEERLDPASESKPQLQRLRGSNVYQVEAMYHGGKDKVLSIGIPAKSLDPDLPSPHPAWGRVSGKIWVRLFWRDLFGVVAELLTWVFLARPV